MIPYCYDPVYQAERREREFDRLVERLPLCACCGYRLAPGTKHRKLRAVTICESCFWELQEQTPLRVEDPADE